MEFDAKATGAAQGMKNIGAFIEDLVKHNSATMIANLPVILRQLDAGMSKFRFKCLLLYTVSVLFHAEYCIRQLWSSSIITYNINSITHNQYTN